MTIRIGRAVLTVAAAITSLSIGTNLYAHGDVVPDERFRHVEGVLQIARVKTYGERMRQHQHTSQTARQVSFGGRRPE